MGLGLSSGGHSIYRRMQGQHGSRRKASRGNWSWTRASEAGQDFWRQASEKKHWAILRSEFPGSGNDLSKMVEEGMVKCQSQKDAWQSSCPHPSFDW